MSKQFNQPRKDVTPEVIKALFNRGFSDREMAEELRCSPQFINIKRCEFGFIRKNYNGGNFAIYPSAFGRIKGHTWQTQMIGRFEDEPEACKSEGVMKIPRSITVDLGTQQSSLTGF